MIGVAVKYADNILKGFATAVSLILSALISFYALNDLHPSVYVPSYNQFIVVNLSLMTSIVLTSDRYFVTGAVMVIVATLMYSSPPPTKTLKTNGIVAT